MPNDAVVVAAGEGGSGPDQFPRPTGPRAGTVVVAVVAAIVGLAVFGSESNDPPGTAELDPPQVAAAAPPPAGPASSDPPEIAVGWNRLELPGDGTVVAIAHGGGGWMALSRGEQANVATSADARVWVTRNFPGSLDGEVRSLVDGSRLIVVDSAVRQGGGARSWISSDGGISWDTTLFPNGFVRVETLATSGSRLFAGGAYSTDAKHLLEEGGPSTAAAWEYTEGTWSPLALPDLPGRHSEIEALVTGPDGLMAFGQADGRPAVWGLAGSSLVSEEISVPRQVELGAFSSVTRSIAGWWLAEFETRTGVAYAMSTDLHTWDLVGSGYDGSRRTSVAATRFGIVHVGDDDLSFRVVDESGVREIGYRYPGTVTGFDPDRHTAVVASDGDLIVMGGGTYSPAIWVRGLIGGRVGMTARPPSDTGRWRLEQTFGPGFRTGDPRPFQVVRSDDEYVIATPQGVWRTPDPVSARPVRDQIVAESLIPTGRGLLLIDSGSRLFRYAGGGSWVPERLPLSVGGVTESPSSLLAYGWNDQGEPVIAVRSDGDEWRIVASDSSSPVYPVAAAEGRIFGFDGGRSPRDGGRVTTDGVTWTPFEIERLGGLESGVPFLVTEASSNSTTVEVLGAGSPLVVPTIDPIEIVRVGSRIRVRGSDGLWETSDDGATWLSYPIGIEHRLKGPIRLFPSEQPMLLVASRDSYRAVTFQP